ncbi:hypothetical protein V8E55_002819 [Tylopilus felleus]
MLRSSGKTAARPTTLAQFGLANILASMPATQMNRCEPATCHRFVSCLSLKFLQTLLQMLATYVNVSTVSAITFTPDATVEPNGSEYFIRFNSLSYTNGSSPADAIFTLAGMIDGIWSVGHWHVDAHVLHTYQHCHLQSTNGATKPILATGLVALVALVTAASFL